MLKLLALLLLALPAFAQVERVAMRTSGISCGLCAGLSEIYFRRLPNVDQVKISRSKEAIMLTFHPNAVFDPAAIRNILKPLEVRVVQFQVGARGQAQMQGGKRMFVAGKQTFRLLETIDSPDVPLNAPIEIEAILYDNKQPLELKALSIKPGK